MAWQYSDENPLITGASNAGRVGRNRDSELISGFIVNCEPFQTQVQYSVEKNRYNAIFLVIRRTALLALGMDGMKDKFPRKAVTAVNQQTHALETHSYSIRPTVTICITAAVTQDYNANIALPYYTILWLARFSVVMT